MPRYQHIDGWRYPDAVRLAFMAAYPAATSLRLEPSIWTDHPGSLS